MLNFCRQRLKVLRLNIYGGWILISFLLKKKQCPYFKLKPNHNLKGVWLWYSKKQILSQNDLEFERKFNIIIVEQKGCTLAGPVVPRQYIFALGWLRNIRFFCKNYAQHILTAQPQQYHTSQGWSLLPLTVGYGIDPATEVPNPHLLKSCI